MSRATSTAPPVRCLLVWAAVSAVAWGLLQFVRPCLSGLADVRSGDDVAALPYPDALTLLAGLLLSACIVWWWSVSTLAVVEAATSIKVSGCPDSVRRVVLVVCGLSLATGLTPAVADTSAGAPPSPTTPSSLAGLQVPDRSPQPIKLRPVPRSGQTVVVEPGDSLWALAAERLPSDASNAAVDARWRQIWRANRRVIGADPDLILPGAELRFPRGSQPTDPHQEQ